MKFYALFAAMLLSGGIAFAQNDDPTIMTINGQPVSRSEFEYSYNKNNSEGVIDKKSVDEYVDLFVNYKLKVLAAKDARIDTLSSFKKEFLQYRDQQIRPTMINEADLVAEAHKIYDETRERVTKAGGMVRPAHIMIRLGQKATAEEQEKAKLKADSIYNALADRYVIEKVKNKKVKKLVKGADFAEMARKYSDDKGSAVRGGDISWISKGQTVKAFEETAFSMKKGEISKPVLSEFGYHIIKLEDKQDFFPYDSVKNDILRFIDARGIRERIVDQKLDSIVKTLPAGTDRETILDKKTAELTAKDSNLKYLVQEYHDGLMLYEISNRMVWEKAAKDEKALAAYFAKNKKKYKWEQPRFKGIAYHVKDAADVAAVKKCVKGKPFSEWAELLRNAFNADSVVRIRVEKGIFKEGDNALIDSVVFKKNAKVEKVKDYPIDATFGKILKKGPKEYTDVKALVVADYQDQLEKDWVAGLRKKYQFVVDPEVLATVNKH